MVETPRVVESVDMVWGEIRAVLVGREYGTREGPSGFYLLDSRASL